MSPDKESKCFPPSAETAFPQGVRPGFVNTGQESDARLQVLVPLNTFI